MLRGRIVSRDKLCPQVALVLRGFFRLQGFRRNGRPSVYLSLNSLSFCLQIMVDSGDEFFFKNIVDKSSKFPCYVGRYILCNKF
jgi:hypothetical protein